MLAIDSGLTYMGFPHDMMQIMKAKNLGQSGECDPVKQLGNITLVIGGEKFH